MKKGEVYVCTCGCGTEVKITKVGKNCEEKCELSCCETPMVLKK